MFKIILLILYNLYKFCLGIYEFMVVVDSQCDYGYLWIQVAVIGVINILFPVIMICDMHCCQKNIESEATHIYNYGGTVNTLVKPSNSSIFTKKNWQYATFISLIGLWLQISYIQDSSPVINSECRDLWKLFFLEVINGWVVIPVWVIYGTRLVIKYCTEYRNRNTAQHTYMYHSGYDI